MREKLDFDHCVGCEEYLGTAEQSHTLREITT